jgi:hypothetical protein
MPRKIKTRQVVLRDIGPIGSAEEAQTKIAALARAIADKQDANKRKHAAQVTEQGRRGAQIRWAKHRERVALGRAEPDSTPKPQ